VDGTVKRDDVLHMLGTERGRDGRSRLFHPNLVATDILRAGDIGYIATGLKAVADCRVGDTVTWKKKERDQTVVERLPGYKEIRPAVYASMYPVDGDDYTLMRDALDKLKLNDAAFTFEPESNQALGRGFRCGFLGLLHLEIIQARLSANLISCRLLPPLGSL
jgi:GTP-binding protein LepA